MTQDPLPAIGLLLDQSDRQRLLAAGCVPVYGEEGAVGWRLPSGPVVSRREAVGWLDAREGACEWF